MIGDPKWRAEMLVQLSSTPVCYETVTRTDGDDVARYHEDPSEIVARAVATLDLILEEVGKPKCEACAALTETIERLA